MTQVKEGLLVPFRAFDSVEKAKSGGQALYDDALRQGIPMATWLNDRALQDPSGDFTLGTDGQARNKQGMDPYQVLLRECNIRTDSDPKAGIYAHSMDRFFASDQPYSLLLFPEYLNRIMRAPLIQSDILPYLIATYSPVNGAVQRSIYLNIPSPFTGDVTYRQMSRVAQGAEIPVTMISTKEQVANLYKYGRALQISYEAMRRIQINLFTILLQQVAMQAMLDKAGTALDVAINGDGNSNPAINYNLTALDSTTTAGNLTYAAWLAFQMNFYPYVPSVVIGNLTSVIKLLTMSVPGLNAQNVFTMLRPGPVNDQIELPQGIFNTTKVIYLPSAPANTLVGIDQRFALELLNEIGGNMTETDKQIRMQFTEVVLSEVVGVDKILTDAVRTLTLNA